MLKNRIAPQLIFIDDFFSIILFLFFPHDSMLNLTTERKRRQLEFSRQKEIERSDEKSLFYYLLLLLNGRYGLMGHATF